MLAQPVGCSVQALKHGGQTLPRDPAGTGPLRVSGDVSTGFDSPALLPIVPVTPGGIDLFLLLSVGVIIPGCREPKSDELQTRSSYRGPRPTVTAPCKRERRHRGGCLLTRGQDGGETAALPGGEKEGDTSPPSPWSLCKASPSHEASPAFLGQ